MDVSVLVTQMHDTLSTIHTTIASLNTTQHDEKLDELERRRENTIQTLVAAFTAESQTLAQNREAERQAIAERRRREDEERERKRRMEDEELAAMEHEQDEERNVRLRKESQEVEEETDNLMSEVEAEAQRVIEDGKKRLRELEEKRKELNSLIDEQLKMPLPVVPTRARRGARFGFIPPVVAAESKPSEPAQAREPVSNPDLKAREDPEATQVDVPAQVVPGFIPEPLGEAQTPMAALKEDDRKPAVGPTTEQSRHQDSVDESRDPPSLTASQMQVPTVNPSHPVPEEDRETTASLAPGSEAPVEKYDDDEDVDEDIRSVAYTPQEETRSTTIRQVFPVPNSHGEVTNPSAARDLELDEDSETSSPAADNSLAKHMPMQVPQVVVDEPSVTVNKPVKEPAEDILDAYQGEQGEVRGDDASVVDSEGGINDDSVHITADMHNVNGASEGYPAPLTVAQEAKTPAVSHSDDLERDLEVDDETSSVDEASDVEEASDVREIRRWVPELAFTKPRVAIPGATKAIKVFDNLVRLVETLEKSQPHQDDDSGDGGEKASGSQTTDTHLSLRTIHADAEGTAEGLEREEMMEHGFPESAADVNLQGPQSPHVSERDEAEVSTYLHDDQPGLEAERKTENPASFHDQETQLPNETEDTSRLSNQPHPSAQEYLIPGNASTDTESQVFVTPMTSAGFRSPNISPQPQQRTLAYELNHAVDESDYEEHENHYPDPGSGGYRLEEEHTTTVHGEDNLFDDDENSDKSSGVRSNSSHRELEGEHADRDTHGQIPPQSSSKDDIHASMPGADDDDAETEVPPAEVPGLVNSASLKNDWPGEAESYFEEEGEPPTALTTPPTQAGQTPATDIAPLELTMGTLSPVDKGLSASRHNPQRPETPEQNSAEGDFDAGHFVPRDVTNVPWHEKSGWTPQSLHSQSTLESSPSSPEQVHSHDTHDPAIRHSWQTGSTGPFAGRMRGDSIMTDSNSQFGPYDASLNNKDKPPPPLPQWHQENLTSLAPSQMEIPGARDDDPEGHNAAAQSTSTSGTLFQRMRSVFEQVPSQASSNGRARASSLSGSPLVGKGSPVPSRQLGGLPRTNSSRTGIYHDHADEDDDSDERSSLLGSTADTRLSA